jgi:hypothetical protein
MHRFGPSWIRCVDVSEDSRALTVRFADGPGIGRSKKSPRQSTFEGQRNYFH